MKIYQAESGRVIPLDEAFLNLLLDAEKLPPVER
jgi:hypothetical protein